MTFAVVRITGPEGRRVYINDDPESVGKTNREYAVRVGPNTFKLKPSQLGPGVNKAVRVEAQDPPLIVDLTPS